MVDKITITASINKTTTIKYEYNYDIIGGCGLTFQQLVTLYKALYHNGIGAKIIKINEKMKPYSIKLEKVPAIGLYDDDDDIEINENLLEWFKTQGITDHITYLENKIK